MSFVGEIKRRKVFQVAAVYLVVAWLLVQIVATVEAPLSLPDWVDTLVIVLLAVGFPIAIILSWAFDLTPHGFVRDISESLRASAAGDDARGRAARESSGPLIFAPGERCGPYEIESTVGASGTGTVYRARDTRLGRSVALKILPPCGELTEAAAERLFHEARAASALDHPNVMTILDVGVEQDVPYIVMKLIEGQPLRDLLAGGPLSLARVTSLGMQIADALAAAHAQGIVHRDLQPTNVLVTGDDQVKLSNFGLDEAIWRLDESGLPQPMTPDDALAHAARASHTIAYLAPERVRGEPADYRSDQFSFGALLYEMVTGRRAFGGASEADTRAAVLQSDPEPVSHFNPQIPMPLQWAIQRCLAKESADRYPSTRDLYEEIAAIAATVQQSTTNAGSVPQNLPAQRTALIGREDDLQMLKALAAKPETRFITLTGPGGIGKTRLLIETGRQLLADFPGGVFFVPLDRISDPDLVPSEIAGALNVQELLEGPTTSALKTYLQRHCTMPTLLLIDNFEHLLEAAPLLADLLSSSEQIKIIATSRAALRVYGEHEFSVEPLRMPDEEASMPAEELAESPAVRLFLDRATAVRATGSPEGNVGVEELRIIADICARLDGLPLAIELAAARSRALTLPRLLDRVRDPLEFLSSGARDLPARQKTLRATLDWSYNLLAEPEQKLFRRLGVFVGGAALDAIEAVCNVDDDLGVDLVGTIESLVDNSLLRHLGVGREPRYAMLGTMREYALERLTEAEEESHSRRAHAAYCVVLAEESQYATTETQREALHAQFDLERGNLRAALDWLIQSGEAQWGLRLASGLGHYWTSRARYSEGHERLIKLLALEGASEESALLVSAMSWRADMARAIGRIDEAIESNHTSLALAKKLGIVPGILRSLNAIAIITLRSGDPEDVQRYLDEALEVAREAGISSSLVGGIMINVAHHSFLQGDLDRAQAHHEEAAALFREAGDEIALAWSLDHQGDIARERGKLDTARQLYEEALAKFRVLEERPGIAGCLYDLAGIVTETGDHDDAARLGAEALAIYSVLGHQGDIPRVLDGLARAAEGSGEPGRALTLAGSAAAMRQSLSIDMPGSLQTKLDQSLDSARAQMTSADAAASWMAGWGLGPEAAIAFALGDGQNASPPSATT